MDLVQYIRLLGRWLWLILLAAFIGAGFSFIVQVNQAPVYRAYAKVIVGSALDSPNPNYIEIRTGIDLAVTYAEILRTYDILDAVVQILDLPFPAERLDRMIDTSIINGTSLLEVSVTHTDRILAAEIANELVAQLILQSPSNLTLDQQANIDLLQGEINAQTEILTLLRDDLRAVNQPGQDDVSLEDSQVLSNERITLTNQINDASANIAQNLNTIASLTQRTNSVEIIEAARIPTQALGSSILTNVILGSLILASFTFGAVLIYEHLNDKLRNADEITQALNLPVLGVIANFGKKDASYSDRLITNLQNFSQISEAYRTLRTNILYSVSKKEYSFVISSATPEEGKSITASNLAISMALSGLRVLLIDADLRRSKIHEIFGLPNQLGLANLLSPINLASEVTRKSNAATVSKGKKDGNIVIDKNLWVHFTQKTTIPNLLIITSGFTPTNPSELLGSSLMKRWMKEFRESRHIDVVIFDTPPVLAVSDSTILAASLNTMVIQVVNAKRTRRGVAQKAKAQFENVNANIIGTVLNNANLREEVHYDRNYAYYYSNSDTEE